MKIIFETGGHEWTIPELTVYDWYHVQEELILNPEASFSILSYLSGCQKEILKEMLYEDYLELWDITQKFLNEQSHTNKFPDKYYKFQGIKYGLINPDQMTIGQFADLDILINGPGSETKIHEIMAYLYRPMKGDQLEDYDIEKTKQRAETFKLVPLKEAVKALNFFLLFGQQYLNNIVDYLNLSDLTTETPEAREIIQMTQTKLLEAGTLLSSFYLEESSRKWTWSPSSKSVRLSIG